MFTYRLGLLGFLLWTSTQALAADHCIVLQHHHISEEILGVTGVTPALLQQHLDYLLVSGQKVLTLQDIVDTLKNDTELPENCVAPIIDHAHLSAYTEVFHARGDTPSRSPCASAPRRWTGTNRHI